MLRSAKPLFAESLKILVEIPTIPLFKDDLVLKMPIGDEDGNCLKYADQGE